MKGVLSAGGATGDGGKGLDDCGCWAGNGLPLAPSAWFEKEEMGCCCGVTVEKESIGGCCCGGEKFEGEKLALKP